MVNPVAEPLSKSRNAPTEKPLIHVLYVDDETGLLKVAKPILEMQGAFQVETASSVEDALKRMEKKTFDVIISDYIMPGKDGLEFLRELRENGNSIPFILFTGKGREIVAIKALNLGADQYVNKIGNPEAVYSELAHGIRTVVKGKKAEKALHESEEKYRNMLEQVPDLVLTVDEKGIVTSCNSVLEKNTDFSKNEVVGKHFLATPLLHEVDPETAQRVFNSILEGKHPERIEIKWFLKDGTRRISEIRIGLTKKDGKIVGFTAVARDITEHKKAEEKLRESEEKFRNLAERSPNMIFINKKGRVVYANKRCEEIMGYKKEEFYSPDFNFFNLIAPDSLEMLKSSYGTHLNGKEVPTFEYTLITKKGRRIDAMLASKLITYEGEPAILGIITDITERKKVEAELRREKKLMEWVTANNAAALAIISEDFRILWANRCLTETLGDIEGKVCYSTLNNLTDVCPGCGVKEILETGKDKVVHEQVVTGFSGKKVWLEITAIPIRDKNGNLIAVSEMAIDMTERKRAEEALMQSEKRFRELSELLPEVVFEIDASGLLTFVNQAAFERFGYSEEEFAKGLDALQMLVPKDRKRGKENMSKILRGETVGVPSEYTALKKDGTTFPCIITSTPIIHENKPAGIRGLIVNMAYRKKTEEKLRESEKKYRELLNGMNDTAWVVDFDCNIIDVNNAAVEILGYSREELLSMKIYDIDFSLDPEVIKRLAKEMPADERQVFETVHTAKDGKKIPVEISSSLVTYRGKRVILSIARDITARKNAEKKLEGMMNDLVKINEKLGVVGKLTRHDARNKLAVIANNVYLAKMKAASNPGVLEYLGDIESAIYQMEKIFDFARNYEMLGVDELSQIDVEKSVEEATVLFPELANIQLVNECKNLTVIADSLLRQLFYNLIDNTLKHGETVTQIRVYYEEEENALKLVYEDNGVGIPEKEKETIFKEGYGKGTGYGLYMIRKICENYGWTINETGVPGKGAQFTMTIPKTDRI
jgi:PAS domain S-box-containing protein